MNYFDGSRICLGDIVTVPVPSGKASARIVMLGETYEHLNIDPAFLTWVEQERVLDSSHVVIEWLAANPFAHNNPSYAPVGNYMFSPVDRWLTCAAQPGVQADVHEKP